MTVTVSTDAGEIRLTGLAGQVTAHTNAGDINLSALSGPIEVTDHAGSIRGQQLSSPRATLSTSVGAIDASFSAAPAALTADATVGSVTLHVPGGISYAVDAHSSVGSTHDQRAAGAHLAAFHHGPHQDGLRHRRARLTRPAATVAAAPSGRGSRTAGNHWTRSMDTGTGRGQRPPGRG